MSIKKFALASVAALSLMLAAPAIDTAKAAEWNALAVNNGVAGGLGINYDTRVRNGVNVMVGNQVVGATASVSSTGTGANAPVLPGNINVGAVNNGYAIGLGGNIGTTFRDVTNANVINGTAGASASVSYTVTGRTH